VIIAVIPAIAKRRILIGIDLPEGQRRGSFPSSTDFLRRVSPATEAACRAGAGKT
jgi:hypothetical protein